MPGQNAHTVPNGKHCAFAVHCAFNPTYGFFSLERRRFYRVPLQLPVRVFVASDAHGEAAPESLASKYCDGETVDLSLGGTCFRTPIRFPLGTVLRLDFLHSAAFSCQGQVVWGKQAGTEQWMHGLRFTVIGKDERAAVVRLVSSQSSAGVATDSSSVVPSIDIVTARSVALLLRLLRAKDPDTFAHSLRTASHAKVLGKALDLSREELQMLRYGAALHDLGKLEISRNLLESTAVLTPAQMEVLKTHAICGARLLESHPALRPFSIIARYHHERFDGNGYPDGLKGEETPFLSRILTVVDSIDAMAYSRPYRCVPLDTQQIIRVLEEESGRQFDPEIANEAMQLLAQGKLILTPEPPSLSEE